MTDDPAEWQPGDVIRFTFDLVDDTFVRAGLLATITSVKIDHGWMIVGGIKADGTPFGWFLRPETVAMYACRVLSSN